MSEPYFYSTNKFSQLKQEVREYRILILSLFIGFFYLVLRYSILDNFLWVLIPPALSLYYIFQINYGWLSNKMDKIILYFLINGLIILVVGLLVGPNKLNIVRIFIHLYLPASLYYISRKYTSFSINNVFRLIRIVWIISILLAVDVLVEYYLIGTDSYLIIPWVREAMRAFIETQKTATTGRALFFNPMIVSSILTSGKAAGIAIAILFSFLVPFALKKKNVNYKNSRPFNDSKISILLVLLMLIACSILLPNFSATVSLFLGLLFIGFYTKRLFRISLLLIPISLFFTFSGLSEVLTKLIILKIFDFNPGTGGTNLQAILEIAPIIDYYKIGNPLTLFFGKAVMSDLYTVSSPAELDLLVYPINYGFPWFIITSMGILVAIKYCHQIVKYVPNGNIEHTLGLSFLGFILVLILSNLHYPHFDDHGISELLFIMLGVLVSLHELTFKTSKPFETKQL